MSEFLAAKGYQVFGLVRGQNNPKTEIVLDENPALELVDGDLRDLSSLIAAVEQVQPDEVYNLGAMSFVALSFRQPELTADITGVGVLRMLEAIRIVGGTDNNPIRFYQASSSEMFGKVRETPQTEQTPFHPRSPYGVAKVFGHYMTVNYRESYGIHASSGICFNHEGERRGLEFVTRKITNGVARIKLGLQDTITLGNLDSQRDWGYAGDFVEAMWLMLQQDEPDDYVIATGETHTIREFLDVAFRCAGIDDWTPYVEQDPRFMRPAEVDLLIGDPTKARTQLGWKPTVAFEELVRAHVRARPRRRSRPRPTLRARGSTGSTMAEARAGAAERTLRHPWIIAAVALLALAASWIVAVQNTPPEWERTLTTWLNDAPDWVAHAMWPVMQGGTLFAPFVVALVIGLVRRDWFVAAVVMVVGVVTWFGAQGVKRIVEPRAPGRLHRRSPRARRNRERPRLRLGALGDGRRGRGRRVHGGAAALVAAAGGGRRRRRDRAGRERRAPARRPRRRMGVRHTGRPRRRHRDRSAPGAAARNARSASVTNCTTSSPAGTSASIAPTPCPAG